MPITINKNTGTVLTISSDDVWDTNPDNTSQYSIIDGYEKRGVLTEITNSISSEEPLTFSGHVSFLVGKAK